MATLAFMLALTGGAYAALNLPKNSVGPKQIRKAAVANSEVKKGSLAANRLSLKARKSLSGQTGPPGLVRAYGHVLSGGVLDTARAHSGIVSVRANGSYTCVKLDPAINASTASPIVTADFSGFSFSSPNQLGWAVPNLSPSCTQGNEIGVAVGSFGPITAGADPTLVVYAGPFFIAVP
jgi:hypothetical protein